MHGDHVSAHIGLFSGVACQIQREDCLDVICILQDAKELNLDISHSRRNSDELPHHTLQHGGVYILCAGRTQISIT